MQEMKEYIESLRIKGQKISYSRLDELLKEGVVYLYNDYEDIFYRVNFDAEKTRYFAKIVGKGEEYEVFKQTSNVLMETLQQPILITKEEYYRV